MKELEERIKELEGRVEALERAILMLEDRTLPMQVIGGGYVDVVKTPSYRNSSAIDPETL